MAAPKPMEVTVLELGEETFRLRWDFGAIAIWQRSAGDDAAEGKVTAENMLFALHAAISADARSRDVEVPVTIGRLGSLLDDGVKVEQAFKLLDTLIRDYAARTEAARDGAGKASKKANPEPEPDATGSSGLTRSEPSISESPSTSSGA